MPLKSELHHWWPQSLSRYWADGDGVIHQLFASGRVVEQTNPRKFGAIRNAHHIKFGDAPSPWEFSFEGEFGAADSAFRGVIAWIENLERLSIGESATLSDRFLAQEVGWDALNELLHCLLSLVVRSPRFRNQMGLTIEHYRESAGFPTPSSKERLININLRQAFDIFVKDTPSRGKFLILFSDEREFVFGDGFYNNYKSPANAPNNPRILVPLTPNACVLYARPHSYFADPPLVTLNLLPKEADLINETVLVHSCDFVFFRSQQPDLVEEFTRGEFLQYEWDEHPAIRDMISAFTQRSF